MTTFSIIAAALALIALLTVILPIFKSPHQPGSGASPGELNVAVYRDQLAQMAEDLRARKLSDDQYRSAREEIERRLLEDVPDASAGGARRGSFAAQALAIAVGVAVPLLAVPIYLVLGSPALLSAQPVAGAHGAGAQQIDAMVGRLAARLAKQPDDGQGWTMLARSYAALGRFGEASSAYAKAVSIISDQPQLLADYADALAMARGGRLRGEPEELVDRA
ncbi:MAG: c-type cytochrome biogenesis protein CcmI, partial [Betaproteobacteria bacterium]|nr:c-type cytochrome biogenesis protein CcmI [Betaproteobacteria bacterium]